MNSDLHPSNIVIGDQAIYTSDTGAKYRLQCYDIGGRYIWLKEYLSFPEAEQLKSKEKYG